MTMTITNESIYSNWYIGNFKVRNRYVSFPAAIFTAQDIVSNSIVTIGISNKSNVMFTMHQTLWWTIFLLFCIVFCCVAVESNRCFFKLVVLLMRSITLSLMYLDTIPSPCVNSLRFKIHCIRGEICLLYLRCSDLPIIDTKPLHLTFWTKFILICIDLMLRWCRIHFFFVLSLAFIQFTPN